MRLPLLLLKHCQKSQSALFPPPQRYAVMRIVSACRALRPRIRAAQRANAAAPAVSGFIDARSGMNKQPCATAPCGTRRTGAPRQLMGQAARLGDRFVAYL